MALAIEKHVFAARPFEQHVWPLQRMGCHELFVELAALLFEHSDSHFYPGVGQTAYSTARDFFVWICRAYNDAPEAALHEQIRAWWGLAVVRTRLQSDIDR